MDASTGSCSDILFLKLDSRIIRLSSNPVCGFSTMGLVRLCAAWPYETRGLLYKMFRLNGLSVYHREKGQTDYSL